MLLSSGGAGTIPTTTRYRRTNMAGARRLGGGASPGLAAGKATPEMTPPTGAAIVPEELSCSSEWSTDAGATFTDPEDDILALVWDALILTLALVWDALSLYLRPPPMPDLLQGSRWELGIVVLVSGPMGIMCAPENQDKVEGGGDARLDSPSPGRAPSSSLLPWTTRAQRRDDPPPPQGPHTRGELVGPKTETDVVWARTPPHETHGKRRGRDEAPVGEPPGLARDGPR